MVTNLTANLVVFLLLPDKVYAAAIHDLQYRVAKMQSKSEMHVKYGLAIFFLEEYEYKHRLSMKIAP